VTRRRLSVPIALALAGAFALVILAMAATQIWTALGQREARLSLIRERNDRALDAMATAVRNLLEPVSAQVEYLVERIDAGALDPADTARLAEQMGALIAATPQVSGALFVALPTLNAVRVDRLPGSAAPQITHFNLRQVEQGEARARTTLAAAAPFWGEPIWDPVHLQALINLRAPVRRGGHVVGGVGITVSVHGLSEHLSETGGEHGFVLRGRDRVLAFHNLVWPEIADARSAERPLPRRDEVDDRVLAALWEADHSHRGRAAAFGRGEGHILRLDNERFGVIHRTLRGYGDEPWYIGRYFPLSELDEEFDRIRDTFVVTGVVLTLALALAAALARRIGRPIRQLAEAALAMRALRFDAAQPPVTRLSEIAAAARAFEAMREGLKWFALYVPQRLVRRLVARGAEVPTEIKPVTVMFTDIVGFTSLAERMSAEEVAGLLNRHFTLLAACIDAEGGMIDKYIGDAVMAAWGAIEPDPEQALRACRAARAIARAVIEENRRRHQQGREPVRMRIGIHSGPVVVGNIGAAERVNFTLVGAAVNAAQRIEQAGRARQGDADCVIMLSAATAAEAGLAAETEPAGELRISGRDEDIAICRLKEESVP